MANILQSLQRTIIAAFVLLILVILIETSVSGNAITFNQTWGSFAIRWLHVISGVMWIGLLWYFKIGRAHV